VENSSNERAYTPPKRESEKEEGPLLRKCGAQHDDK